MTPPVDQRTADDTFRCADVELLTGGDKLVLVVRRATRTVRYYRPEQVEVLLSCRTFAALDQHVSAACSLRPELPRLLVESS